MDLFVLGRSVPCRNRMVEPGTEGASLAWPVTMIAATLLMFGRTAAQGRRKTEKQPDTTLGRAIFSVWITTGMAMFLLMLFLSMSGRFDWHVFIAAVCALLGLANAASSLAALCFGGRPWRLHVSGLRRKAAANSHWNSK